MSLISDIKTDNSQARGFIQCFSRFSASSFGFPGSVGVARSFHPSHHAQLQSAHFPPSFQQPLAPQRGASLDPSNVLAALVACEPCDPCETLTASVMEERTRVMEERTRVMECVRSLLVSVPRDPSLALSVKLDPFVRMAVPLRCVALLVLQHTGDDIDAMLIDWATWDVLQVALNFRIIIQAVLRTLTENPIWHGLTHQLETVFSHDVATTAMQVAQAFREIGLEGRAPQAALNCLQDLLEHAPASLSQRVKNRLVHTAIHLTKAYDIQPERLVLKNHLQLCGGAAVNGGGFADVWKGILNGEEVCVKVIRTNRKSADAASKEFSKEALIWRQLNHPNVLPFYGVYYMDDARSMLCLVSPWMEHGHVMEYLRKSPPSINRVALAYDVASGLAYLHGENVVHGDLKGANILVSASGKACIGDFGLSSVTDIASIYQKTDDASSSYFCGSANWAAPEVLQSGQLSDKSDIYAFACVVYELFAGHAPFADVPNGGCAILFKVVIAKERAARPLSPVLSDAVWALVTRCWAHEPAERPSAQEAMAALRAELEATPEAKTWDASIPSKIRAALEELPFCPTVDNIKILTGKLSRVDAMDVDRAKPSTGTIRQGTSRADGRRPTKAPYGAARPRATTLRATAPEYVPHSLARSHSEPWQTEVWHAPKLFVRPLVRTPSAPSASPYSPTPSPLTSWSAYAQPSPELQKSKCKTRDSAVWNQWRGDDVDSWEEEDTLVSSRAPSPASTCVDSPQQRTCLLSLNPRAAEFVPCAVSKRECWNF